MPLVIPPGFAQAAMVFDLQDDPQPIIVTIGLDLAGGITDFLLAAADVGAAWSDVGGTSLQGLMCGAYTLRSVRLAVGQDGGPPLVVEAPIGLPGGHSEACLVQNTALLIRKRSALAGREHRGRMFVPGISELNVGSNGTIGATTVTAYQTRANNFLNKLRDAGTIDNAVILHTSPQIGGAPPPTVITNLVVDSTVATQRRRLRR